MLEGLGFSDLIGVFLGFTFTILVFSYVVGDNPLFRVVLHIFIGVASGYAAVLIFYNVILYQLVLPLIESGGTAVMLLIPFLLGVWLLVSKLSVRLSRWGSPVMAYLVGVGAAVAIGGAFLGTILPQVRASSALFGLDVQSPGGNLAKGVLILLGTVTTLIFFHFGARSTGSQTPRRPPWIEGLAQVGQVFIVITFGATFAGVYSASLAALIDRVRSILDLLLPLLPFK
jgi:hypothetical protein